MSNVKRICLLMGILFILSIFYSAVHAGVSISTDKSTYKPGDTVKVTVKVSGVATWNVWVQGSGPVSGSTIAMVGYSDDLSNTTKTATGTFKATGEGSIKFSTTGDSNARDENRNSVGMSASRTVTVKKPTTTTNKPTTNKPSNNTSGGSSNNTPSTPAKKSSNANLTAIKVAEGELTPKFSKSVKSYTLNVAKDIEKVDITATKENSKATYKVSRK